MGPRPEDCMMERGAGRSNISGQGMELLKGPEITKPWKQRCRYLDRTR